MELTTSTCSFCSPLQWSFFSSLCPETTLSVGSFSTHHQCHLTVLVFFTSKVQSVQPTTPAFPLLTPIICMVLVFLLTTKLSCSASSGGCSSSARLLVDWFCLPPLLPCAALQLLLLTATLPRWSLPTSGYKYYPYCNNPRGDSTTIDFSPKLGYLINFSKLSCPERILFFFLSKNLVF